MKLSLIIFIFLFYANYIMAKTSLEIKSTSINKLVETRNAKVTAKRLKSEAMTHRQGSLKRSFLPSLNLGGAQERFKLGNTPYRTQPDYGAELSLNIFNGTKDTLNNKLIKNRGERFEAEKKVTLYEEIIKAKEIYWNLVFLKEQIKLLNEAFDLNQKNLRSAVQRFKGGVGTSADKFEFEMNSTEIKWNIKQAEMNKSILDRELNIILGQNEGTKINTTDALEHQHELKTISNHSEAQHAFLAQPALMQAKESEMSAKIMSRTWWPKIDAFVAFNEYNIRNGNVFDAQEGKETVLGIRLTMNVFDYFNGSAESSALMAESQAALSEAQYLEKQVENEAHSEIANLNFLHNQVHDAEDNIKKADRYLKLTLNEYSRGAKNSPDVLGATEKVTEVKNKYFEILRDFQIIRAHLITKSEI